MQRPTWQQVYMEMCESLAKRSTCLRIQTASLIVKDNVIVSVGYNGVPTHQQHCIEYWTQNNPFSTVQELVESDYFYIHHHDWSNIHEIHGEMNAILFAGKNGIPLVDATLYTLYSPCIQCAKAILTSGITRVYFKEVYKRNTDGIDLLEKQGVHIQQLN